MTDESVSVAFGSLWHLKALHRMVMNRKFDGLDDVFFGSPHLAAAQHAILEALMQAEPQRAAQWESWRDARQHELVLNRVRQHLRDHREVVAAVEPTARRAYVESLLAPLVGDSRLLPELMGE
ncbi:MULTISPECIES: hypothetical protein [unclassified Streptomyces]|uniref:hypothetical protein n=1 Tax=unclassified Streptomyces TaxID=2593676 RepID=UPI0011C1175D|nr:MULTISPECIES: hypothetical protein [unclassified Streptomyces]